MLHRLTTVLDRIDQERPLNDQTETVSSRRRRKEMDHSEAAFIHTKRRCLQRYSFLIDYALWKSWNEQILSYDPDVRLVDDHDPSVYIVQCRGMEIPVSFNGAFITTAVPDFSPCKEIKYTMLPELKRFVPRLSDKERRKLELERQQSIKTGTTTDHVHHGVVKNYDPARGFGFVAVDNKDIFVHAQVVKSCNVMTLVPGTRVQVKVRMQEKGLAVCWIAVPRLQTHELPTDMMFDRNGVPFRPR